MTTNTKITLTQKEAIETVDRIEKIGQKYGLIDQYSKYYELNPDRLEQQTQNLVDAISEVLYEFGISIHVDDTDTDTDDGDEEIDLNDTAAVAKMIEEVLEEIRREG